MELQKQQSSLEVKNYDIIKKNKNSIHGDLLPDSIRCMITGASGAGKTNTMLSLLLDRNGVSFKNIYLYTNSINQEKYKLLEYILKKIPEIGFFTFSENSNSFIEPNQIKPNSVCIFDDFQLSDQKIIKKYFTYSRHFDVNCFYICQSYALVPKHIIRDNLNFLIIFPQDTLNLKHIYEDHINQDMSFNTFKDICQSTWCEEHSFFCLDKTREKTKGKYRFKFDNFITSI